MWIKALISRLKKPSTILSLLSQAISVLLLLGFNINENLVLSIATLVCSILVTLGILSNPDTENKGYGDDIIYCTNEGKNTAHVKINGQMVCTECGHINTDASDSAAGE